MSDSHSHHAHCSHGGASSDPVKARDPVCGMTVAPETTAHHAEH